MRVYHSLITVGVSTLLVLGRVGGGVWGEWCVGGGGVYYCNIIPARSWTDIGAIFHTAPRRRNIMTISLNFNTPLKKLQIS